MLIAIGTFAGPDTRASYAAGIMREQWCSTGGYLYAARQATARKSADGGRTGVVQSGCRYCTQIRSAAAKKRRNFETPGYDHRGPMRRVFIVA